MLCNAPVEEPKPDTKPAPNPQEPRRDPVPVRIPITPAKPGTQPCTVPGPGRDGDDPNTCLADASF